MRKLDFDLTDREDGRLIGKLVKSLCRVSAGQYAKIKGSTAQMRGTINREFCVRYDCKNRWFTGCKSRFLQEVDGAKGTFLRVAELCGDAKEI